MQEIINITRFLTKQKVCISLQNKILSYYTYDGPNPNATYMVLCFKWNGNFRNEHHKIIYNYQP